MPRTTSVRSEGGDSPLKNYFTEISELPLLTADQERKLATEIASGNYEARDHLVRANLRLVVNLARSYTGRGLDLEDLIAEGNLGLLHAVERFDSSMNTRFSTYASFWIKQAIQRALVNTAKTIRVPAYLVALLAKWRQTAHRMQDELGRPASTEEIARRMGLSKKKAGIIQKVIPLYAAAAQADSSETGRSIDEMMVDARAADRTTEVVELQHILERLNKLDPREAAVLRMRYGLDDDQPRTLQQVGECLGLTRERVRQIESEALQKLGSQALGE